MSHFAKASSWPFGPAQGPRQSYNWTIGRLSKSIGRLTMKRNLTISKKQLTISVFEPSPQFNKFQQLTKHHRKIAVKISDDNRKIANTLNFFSHHVARAWPASGFHQDTKID
jgi:hypothetical protein